MSKWAKLTTLTLIGALSVPFIGANVSALDETWGPQDRPTYTWDEPASKPTFNSITNNPEIGKEMNFVRVREATSTEPYEDYVDIEIGKEYEVYVYYHNNASASLNESGAGLAQNVRFKTELPTKLHEGETAVIKGTLSWGTAGDMQEVWDTAFLNAHDTVYLRYVENSATIHNQGNANGSILDADALFGDGALLAHDTNYWGVIPGCNEYAGYITYKVKADQPKFYIEKEVSQHGENSWDDTINVKPGDKLDFKITYTNHGTTEQTSVKVVDKLPTGLTYVEGSTVAVTPAAPEGATVADKIFSDGLVIGDFQPGETATITYSVIVGSEADFTDCTTLIYNDAHVATANGTEYDKVKIVVNKDCAEPTPSELPSTGPVEIILAAVVIAGIACGGYYLYRTRRTLQKVNSDIMNNNDQNDIQSQEPQSEAKTDEANTDDKQNDVQP